MQKKFAEDLYPDVTFAFDVSKVRTGIKKDHTGFQKLEVFDNRTLGRVLVLDSKVQFTELDEHRYHETMAHWPVAVVGYPRHVLIVGGGDLGVARELCKYPFIEFIDVVDIDGQVTRVTRDLMPNIAGEALKDHRVRVGHQDAGKFVKEQTDERYDIIICDTTDETDVAVPLYTKEFVGDLYRLLKENGVLVRVAGTLDLQCEEVKRTARQVREVFGKERSTLVMVGLVCYQGGYFVLAVGQKRETASHWKPLKYMIPIETRWYDPETHEKIDFGGTKTAQAIFGN